MRLCWSANSMGTGLRGSDRKKRKSSYNLLQGEAGVKSVVEILRDELDVTMAMAGCKNLTEITRDYVRLAGEPLAKL